MAMQGKDTQTANAIPIILDKKWDDGSVIEQNQNSLTSLSKNKEFLKLVGQLE